MLHRAHARLSASGAHRWMACPGSVALEEEIPESTSDFAEHGTAAHELAERCLIDDVQADHFAGQLFNGFEADNEMVEAVQVYLDYVRALPGTRFVEQRVDFSPWVPDGFGTCDYLVIDGNKATVVDLKYGRGVRVDAERNPQAMLYALGAMNDYEYLFDEIEAFNLVIVQPRLDHISEWEVSRDELLLFGEEAKARAEEVSKEKAPLHPGETQCKFCRVKGTCRALAEHNLSLISEGFSSIEEPLKLRDVTRLTNQDISTILPKIKQVTDWVRAVEAYAHAELEQGHEVPGYKLVEGISKRAWRDEEEAEKALRDIKLRVADILTKKLVSPAQVEKLLGKKHPLLAKHVIKPAGKPVIATESDKRPAIITDVTDGFSEVA